MILSCPSPDRRRPRWTFALGMTAALVLALLLAAGVPGAPAHARDLPTLSQPGLAADDPTPSAPPGESPGEAATSSGAVRTYTGSPTRIQQPGQMRRSVILIAAPGLRWSDLDKDTTPELWTLVNSGPVGTLSIRSILSPTCVADAWLMISAGRPISDGVQTPACPALEEPAQEKVPHWGRYVRQAAAEEGRPVPGTFGDQLAGSRRKVVSVGPGAAIATATTEGRLVGSYVSPGDGHGPALARALSEQPDLTVVDAGRVWIAEGREPRAAQVARIERVVAQIRPLVPAEATVILAGTGSSDAEPRLGLVALSGYDGNGQRFKAGVLGSGSSRQQGLLRVTDIPATVLDILKVPVPPSIDGAPMRVVAQQGASSEETIGQVSDLERASNAVSPISPWVVGLVLLANLALYLGGWWVLRRLRAQVHEDPRPGHQLRERRALVALRYGALTLGALPIVTFVAALIPWWRSTLPALALVPVVIALAVAVMSMALSDPWRRFPAGPPAALGGITAAVLAADAASGSRLQVEALLGGGQEVSGRLLGMSDPGSALFTTGALLLGIGMADRRRRQGRDRQAVVVVLLLGLLGALIVGLPQFGSSSSGLITLAPGFLLLAVAVSGQRMTWPKVLAVLMATIGLGAGLAALDLARDPAKRTRLGRFVDGLGDGSAGEVVSKKLETVLAATAGSVLTWLLPLTVLFLATVVLRRIPGRDRTPLDAVSEPTSVIERGAAVVACVLGLGFFANDSGAVVPAMGLLLAVPVLVGAIAHERLERLYPEAVRSSASPAPADEALLLDCET